MADDEKVSKAELEAFAKAVGDRVCELESKIDSKIDELASELRTPRVAAIYKCDEEGCGFETDDLGAFIEHTVAEKLKKPPEEKVREEEKPKTHSTVKEFLECPQCRPKILDTILEMPRFQQTLKEHGWEKPKPKPKDTLEL